MGLAVPHKHDSGVASDNAPTLRDSGLRHVGELPWGAHVCSFYETAEDLLATCVPYFAAGLENNEFCVWAVSGPISIDDALDALHDLPDFASRLRQGQIELLRGTDWYLPGGQVDVRRVSDGWLAKLELGLSHGYDGLRASGNALWTQSDYWTEFCQYEHDIDHLLAGKRMLVLCTYALGRCGASDILDVAEAHQCSIARRNGRWEYLEIPGLRREADAADTLRPTLSLAALTPRERVVLAQILAGASNKEAARALGIAPRTVEFHRANIMRKLGVRNTAALVHTVLGA
jgi:DNA-binding CsgD family transcriptional regulator